MNPYVGESYLGFQDIYGENAKGTSILDRTKTTTDSDAPNQIVNETEKQIMLQTGDSTDIIKGMGIMILVMIGLGLIGN